MTALLWLRRDLRRADHPALGAAAETGPVVPLFVIDPRLWAAAGPVRRRWLAVTLEATDAAYDGTLCLRIGDPREVVPAAAVEAEAGSVHVSRETTPFGRRRDGAVAARLVPAGVRWVETGTPYAVGPGLVRTRTGGAYRVFTPFLRAWRAHGWPAPAAEPAGLRWHRLDSDPAAWDLIRAATSENGQVDGVALGDASLPAALAGPARPGGVSTHWRPEPGEAGGAARWAAFRDEQLHGYGSERNRPAVDGTSRLSPYLKLGVLHPRTLLADLTGSAGTERFATELAWREFYADVLWHHPASAWHDLNTALAGLSDDQPQEDAVEAWRTGTTGYPFVDAGMRQLSAEGWMHNRVRMVTASFLTKDLHVRWQVGARHFLGHLIDGDLASNSHGWQWVAGTGTDAAPYFRVFNPVGQGLRFDPDGSYVRRWVPELRHLEGAAAHQPWDHPDGFLHGYPRRIIDHAEQRREALRRYQAIRSGRIESTSATSRR